MSRSFHQFDVVRVASIRADRFAEASVANQRPPAVGDKGTILEVYESPEPAYEVECCDPSTGVTIWLEAMYPEELKHAGGGVE